MKSIFKVEFHKAFHNGLLWIAVFVGVVITVYAGLERVNHYNDLLEANAWYEHYGLEQQVNPDLPMLTLFNSWIGADAISMGSTMFFTMLPLLVVFPYSWSYLKEVKSGYLKQYVIRSEKTKYFFSKFVVLFCVGAVTALLPIIANFMTVSSFIPAIKPDIYYDNYYYISSGEIGFSLFYAQPWLAIFQKIFIIGLISGLLSNIPFAIGFFVENRFTILVSPFVVLLGINYMSEIVTYYMGLEVSLVRLISSMYTGPRFWNVLLLYIAVLFLVPFGIIMWKGKKTDVY